MQNAPRKANNDFFNPFQGYPGAKKQKKQQIMQSYFWNVGIVFDRNANSVKNRALDKKKIRTDPIRADMTLIRPYRLYTYRKQTIGKQRSIFPRASRDLQQFAQMRAKTARAEKIRR